MLLKRINKAKHQLRKVKEMSRGDISGRRIGMDVKCGELWEMDGENGEHRVSVAFPLICPVWELVSLHIGALLDIFSLHLAALFASVGLVGPRVPCKRWL